MRGLTILLAGALVACAGELVPSRFSDGEAPDRADASALALEGTGRVEREVPEGRLERSAAPESGSSAGCPWGAQVPASASAGLAASAHLASGSSDERAVFDRMNQLRGGAPLHWNDCLADLARSHSQDMAQRGYFGHGSSSSPKAFLIVQRAAAAGLSTNPLKEWLTEDVLTGDLASYLGGKAANAVDLWMGSPGHAAPIKECREVGVGIASRSFLGTTTILVTADFLCDT